MGLNKENKRNDEIKRTEKISFLSFKLKTLKKIPTKNLSNLSLGCLER